MYIYYIYIYMAVDQNPCCRRGPPSVTNLRRGPSVANPCQRPLCSRGGVCRRTPPSVTNLCREMANVVDSLPYVYTYLSWMLLDTARINFQKRQCGSSAAQKQSYPQYHGFRLNGTLKKPGYHGPWQRVL